MNAYRASLVVVVAMLMLLGCRRAEQQPPPAPSLPPEEAANARRQIVSWLECEECESGELQAVVKLGATAVPTLSAVLREGPSPASREKLRLHLTDTHRKLVAQGAANPAAKFDIPEDQYVQMYMDNYVAQHRVRSAQGLAAIGGPEAAKALEAAKGYELRADVRDAVNQSLQKVSRQ